MSQWLNEHPQVQQGRFPGRKESHFFHGVFAGLQQEYLGGNPRNDTEDEFYCRVRQRYAQVLYDIPTLEAGIDAKHLLSPVITVDKTPVYIHLQNCPEYVSKTCPWGVKILVLLRNPIDRAYSQHQMDLQSKKHEWGTFEDRIRKEVQRMRENGLNDMPDLPENATMDDVEALEFPLPNRTAKQEHEAFETLVNMPLLKKGLYAIQLREWVKWIPRSNIIIQFYEDLKRDPDKTYRELQRMLGLKDHSLSEYSHFKAGKYQSPMNDVTRRYLERFFEPYNRQMEGLFGPEWRGVWTS